MPSGHVWWYLNLKIRPYCVQVVAATISSSLQQARAADVGCDGAVVAETVAATVATTV